MKDFGNIIYRTETMAYVIDNGTYTVPHPEDKTVPAEIHTEFNDLYIEIDEYAKANPDKVIKEEEVLYEPTIEELKKLKLSEINNKYNIAISTLVATYPETELLTFDKQEQEARAWLEDNSIETPLIDALAEGRQINKADLVNRIINKSDLFAVQTGYLTGQRQYYEDLLGLAQTKEEVEAIIPEYRYYEVGEVSVEA